MSEAEITVIAEALVTLFVDANCQTSFSDVTLECCCGSWKAVWPRIEYGEDCLNDNPGPGVDIGP